MVRYDVGDFLAGVCAGACGAECVARESWMVLAGMVGRVCVRDGAVGINGDRSINPLRCDVRRARRVALGVGEVMVFCNRWYGEWEGGLSPVDMYIK